jgi:hypothetical protein
MHGLVAKIPKYGYLTDINIALGYQIRKISKRLG